MGDLLFMVSESLCNDRVDTVTGYFSLCESHENNIL